MGLDKYVLPICAILAVPALILDHSYKIRVVDREYIKFGGNSPNAPLVEKVEFVRSHPGYKHNHVIESFRLSTKEPRLKRQFAKN